MNKFIGWSILITTIVIMSICSIILIDSRGYFKSYFDIQLKKLNLRSEKSVDSLLNVIQKERKKNDSLFIVTQGLYERDSLKNDNLKAMKKQLLWLQTHTGNLK